MAYRRFNAKGYHTVVTFTCHKTGQMFYTTMDFSMKGGLNQTRKGCFITYLLPAYFLAHLITESAYSKCCDLKLLHCLSHQQQSP